VNGNEICENTKMHMATLQDKGRYYIKIWNK